jgi:hypothetical protein
MAETFFLNSTTSRAGTQNMEDAELKSGFQRLNTLAESEYHQSLIEIVSESDADKVASRLGRLVGVLIKEPFADVHALESPSARTGAYRAWDLKNQADFETVAAQDQWQYKILEQVRDELAPGRTVYSVAQEAQQESGFFGAYAQTLNKYICGDKEVRKKVDEAFKAYAKMGGSLKAPTPEGLVGAGGLTLGVHLVQLVPALGVAGAPVIAALVLILYVLGVHAFCKYSNYLRTDEDEK